MGEVFAAHGIRQPVVRTKHQHNGIGVRALIEKAFEAKIPIDILRLLQDEARVVELARPELVEQGNIHTGQQERVAHNDDIAGSPGSGRTYRQERHLFAADALLDTAEALESIVRAKFAAEVEQPQGRDEVSAGTIERGSGELRIGSR